MAYPAGTSVSYNNCPCLYLQSVIDLIAEEKEYTKPNIGFVDLIRSPENISNSPVKVKINNDGKTQDTANPGKFDFVYYAQDCSITPASPLGSCTAASGGDEYAGAGSPPRCHVEPRPASPRASPCPPRRPVAWPSRRPCGRGRRCRRPAPGPP